VARRIFSNFLIEDYAEAAETLLDLGAEVDAVDEYGASALLLACARNSEEVARVLLSRGANPDHVMRVSPKYRALQVAAHQGYPKVVRLLLESGAFASAPNTEYGTPLHIAISNMDSYNQDGYFEVVKLLLQFNADVNSQQENGSTPLHLAVKRGTPGMERIVRLLREEGADVDKLDNSKRSPLFYAVQDKYEFARLLWDRRSSWNRFSEATISVLFDASKLGLESRVGLLIDAGCKLEEKDVFGRIARDVALKLEVRRLLSVDGQDSGDDEIDICPFVTQAVQARRKFRQIAEWACDVCERGIWEEAFYRTIPIL
jgi:ankyrin repeat protein